VGVSFVISFNSALDNIVSLRYWQYADCCFEGKLLLAAK
jgi:hypothetical protein